MRKCCTAKIPIRSKSGRPAPPNASLRLGGDALKPRPNAISGIEHMAARVSAPNTSAAIRHHANNVGGLGTFLPRPLFTHPPPSAIIRFQNVGTCGGLSFTEAAVGREINRLTGADLRRSKPGVYADGGGLYLQITEAQDHSSINRSWLFRFTLNGHERWMGLG